MLKTIRALALASACVCIAFCNPLSAQSLGPASLFQGTIATYTTTATSSGAVLTVASATGIQKFQAVSGTSIAAGSQVTAVSGTSITVSPAPTAPLTGSSVTFGGLPAASSANKNSYLTILDGATACDISTGGASTIVFAISTGSVWYAPNCGGGGTGGNSAIIPTLTKTSTVLTLGANLSSTVPYWVINGQPPVNVVSLVNSCTLTITSGTGTDATPVFISGSALNARIEFAVNSSTTNSYTVAGTGCALVSSLTLTGSQPLYSIPVTSGAFGTIAPLYGTQTTSISAGSGIAKSENGSTGDITLSTDPTIVPRYFDTSGAPAITCTAGRDFYTNASSPFTPYYCPQTNTWAPLTGVGYVAQTDAATVTWAIANQYNANASLLFTVHSGSRILNITNPVNGGNYVLKLTQDATGGEGLTLGTGCTWKVIGGGSGAITPSTGANAVDVLAFSYDGTNCLATFGKNYN